MKTVFYDSTRLLHRSSSPTPTGIDRVDINYAYFFLVSDLYNVVFIYQEKSVFYVLEKSDTFIQALYDKWIKSENVGLDFSKCFSNSINKKRSISKEIEKVKKNEGVIYDLECIDGPVVDALLKNRGGFYFNTSHHGVGHIKAYQVFKVLGDLKIVFYLHDIIPIDFPEYVREGDEHTHAVRVKAMAEYGDYVLANSSYTKSRFISFCKEFCLVAPNVSVLHIGVEDGFLDRIEKSGTNKYFTEKFDYFVYISTIEPRKNHLMLLHLWRKMVLDERHHIPKLVLIGKRGWNNQNILDLLDRSKLLQNHIIELSGLSDNQMNSILKNSRGLLYPSFVEGWGMPLVEAVAANVPVVCSDIPAHRESGQSLLRYIDPEDSQSWMEVVNKMTTSNEEALDIMSGYKKFKMPAWEEHFKDLNIIINSLDDLKYNSALNTIDPSLIVKRYCSDSSTSFGNDYKNKSFLISLVIRILFDTPGKDRTSRLIAKFKKDPIKYMLDSKSKLLRSFGETLDTYDK